MRRHLNVDWVERGLFGIHLGREVTIQIFTLPSSDGMVQVRFIDTGAVAEVQAREVVLVRVSQERE
jgi:hypothetical protein